MVITGTKLTHSYIKILDIFFYNVWDFTSKLMMDKVT